MVAARSECEALLAFDRLLSAVGNIMGRYMGGIGILMKRYCICKGNAHAPSHLMHCEVVAALMLKSGPWKRGRVSPYIQTLVYWIDWSSIQPCVSLCAAGNTIFLSATRGSDSATRPDHCT